MKSDAEIGNFDNKDTSVVVCRNAISQLVDVSSQLPIISVGRYIGNSFDYDAIVIVGGEWKIYQENQKKINGGKWNEGSEAHENTLRFGGPCVCEKMKWWHGIPIQSTRY